MSSVEWQRNNWHIGAGQTEGVNWTDELTSTPFETLRPKIGDTIAAAHTAHLSFLVKDALWMVLGYGSAEGSFAVKIQQLFHLFSQGPQTKWARWDKDWNDDNTDTSKYIWRFKNTFVEAMPTLSDDGGSITVLIHNNG